MKKNYDVLELSFTQIKKMTAEELSDVLKTCNRALSTMCLTSPEDMDKLMEVASMAECEFEKR